MTDGDIAKPVKSGQRIEVAPVTTPGLSLRKNFSWTFVGNVVYGASQWAMIVVLARLGSPRMVGEFALALAVSTPIVSLLNLQLRSIQATDARHDYSFATYLGLRLVTVAASLGVVLLVALLAGYTFQILLVIAAMTLAKAFESVSDVFYGLQQQSERMDTVAISKMIKGPLALVGLAVAIWSTGNLVVAICVLALARFAILAAIDIPLASKIHNAKSSWQIMRPDFSRGPLLRLVYLALPMGVVTMLVALNTSIPRLLLERTTDAYTLGVFAAIAALMAAGDQVNMALGQSAAPRLAKYFAEGRIHQYRVLTTKLIGIGALLGLTGVIIAIVVAPEILKILFTPEYADHGPILIIIMIAAACAYISSYLGYAMTALRKFWLQAAIASTTTVVALVASVLLIPQYGIVGAAWTVVVAFIIQIPLKSIAIYAVIARYNLAEHT